MAEGAYPHRRRAHGTSMGIDVALRYQEELLKIVQVRHHDAHAAIFFASPFDEAAVLVLDGHGDETAQSAHIGAGNRLQRLWQSEVFDSLGYLYMAATKYLGFDLFQEGTVMALAGTGGPTYANKFRQLIHDFQSTGALL